MASPFFMSGGLMTDLKLAQSDWDIRLHIYKVFVSQGRAPSCQAVAAHVGIEPEAARQALRRLHAAHALFLRPGSDDILMAPPLSAIETDYQVETGGLTLYASCAWDSLGIPAMLKQDAQISIRHPLTRERIQYAVKKGQLEADSAGYVHFARRFEHWYDDLVDT